CGGGSEGCESAQIESASGWELMSISREQCAGEEPTYCDADGNEVDGATLTGEALFPEEDDVEQQVMCHGAPSVVRRVVAVKGQPAFDDDSDFDGEAFTHEGDVSVGSCGGGSEGCESG